MDGKYIYIRNQHRACAVQPYRRLVLHMLRLATRRRARAILCPPARTRLIGAGLRAGRVNPALGVVNA